jgi:hypothetical protein
MDFLTELQETAEIPNHIAVPYKFFDLFKVLTKDSEDGVKGMYWGKDTVDTKLTDDELSAFKAYIKATRSELRKGELNASQCNKRLWFFFQKLLQVSAFTLEVRNEIRGFMDICEYIIL